MQASFSFNALHYFSVSAWLHSDQVVDNIRHGASSPRESTVQFRSFQWWTFLFDPLIGSFVTEVHSLAFPQVFPGFEYELSGLTRSAYTGSTSEWYLIKLARRHNNIENRSTAFGHFSLSSFLRLVLCSGALTLYTPSIGLGRFFREVTFTSRSPSGKLAKRDLPNLPNLPDLPSRSALIIRSWKPSDPPAAVPLQIDVTAYFFHH